VVGLCYEHSPAEGIGVLNIVDEFLTKLKGEVHCTSEDGDIETIKDNEALEALPQPKILQWTTTVETKSAVKEAAAAIDE